MNAQIDLRARRGRKDVVLKYPLGREPRSRVRRTCEGRSLKWGSPPENVVGSCRDMFRELSPSVFYFTRTGNRPSEGRYGELFFLSWTD